jgi:hypothetical protein
VKLEIDKAIMPLVSDAKHDFKVDADPILSSRISMFRVDIRDEESKLLASGPEITKDGRFHEVAVEEDDGSVAVVGGLGGPPMIPPSR